MTLPNVSSHSNNKLWHCQSDPVLWIEGKNVHDKFSIDRFHLGADLEKSKPTKGLPNNAEQIFHHLAANTVFLMVGTIEPRKAHAEVLITFEKMWREGDQSVLVLVGKPGWMVEKFIEKIQNHEEMEKRLLWLEGISDEFLEKIYAVSDALIAASHGEGFGLPLIEAAQHKIAIIARDIPVFREVAGRGHIILIMTNFKRYFLLLNRGKLFIHRANTLALKYCLLSHGKEVRQPYSERSLDDRP
ncbi:MAG: hypothetical protein COB29_14150 [Sulfitobacter sp.]|nr:MAG: hypothetical protein COB29_14150 [Sulfitobacter sp.]